MSQISDCDSSDSSDQKNVFHNKTFFVYFFLKTFSSSPNFFSSKTQTKNVTKLLNLKLWLNSKTQIVMKIENSPRYCHISPNIT